MSVPDFQTLLLPVLKLTSDGNEHAVAELRERISQDLKLTSEELSERLPSRRQTVFANRVAWSTVYLHRALALERTTRGVFRITARGRALLEDNPERIDVKTLRQFPEFVAFHKPKPIGHVRAEDGAVTFKVPRGETPEEQLAAAYNFLREALANDVLEAVKRSTPAFFEQMVVDLLVAMGYGGSTEDAAQAVGRSGDGGIDGIIKQDKLGLDVVYVQAKRWSHVVGRPVVQGFAGSLEGVRARKGVLITTSHFSQDALDYVEVIDKRIVLIDGGHLAELMIDHDIGVNVAQMYKVKRLDSDYFEGG